MQHVYFSTDYDPDGPRDPVLYLASLAKEPVTVTIRAPISSQNYQVSNQSNAGLTLPSKHKTFV